MGLFMKTEKWSYQNIKHVKLKITKNFFCRNKNDVNTNALNMPTLKDEIKRLPSIKVSSKAKGLDMIMGKGGELRVIVIIIII